MNAAAHVPLTRPSHLSMFTGRYPSGHGIRDNISPSFATPGIPVLAEVLRDAGFRTAAFVSSIVLTRQSGLNRGFETYADRFAGAKEPDQIFLNTIQKRGDDTTREALEWLREARASTPAARLALWVHLYDPHDPYEPPEPFATQYAGRPYDGEVAWSDTLVGQIRGALEHSGLLDSSLVVVTSDHGEGLGEHGESGHGFFVYESTLRVPLVMRGPGLQAGSRVEPLIRLVDLFPTVLDLLDVALPRDAVLSGRNVTAALNGGDLPEADSASYGETLVPLLHYGWSDLRSIRDGRWKYVLAPRAELYDLATDPGELQNLVNAQPARARALRVALESELKRERAAVGDNSAANVPADLLEKLGALGYVSAGPPSAARASGADPKDKIEEFRQINGLMREGLSALHAGDFRTSADRLGRLDALGIDSFEVNFYSGRALAGLGRHPEAIRRFETALERLPSFGPTYLALADSFIARRDLAEAIVVLRRGQAASPRDASLYEREAEVWRRRKNPGEAVTAYERMLPLAPRDALVRVRLGELYRDLGNTDAALIHLREAVILDPSPASYWNALGMVLGGSADLPGAESAFREAVSRDRQNAQYLYNLALSLERQGRPTEAADLYRQVLALQPTFRAAADRLRGLG